MKGLTLICLLCAALMWTACNTGSHDNANNHNGTNTSTPSNKPADTKPTATAPTNTTSTTPTTTDGVTGVAACDDYLAKVEDCMNNRNVPDSAKAVYRQTLEQNRAAWKQAASIPQGRAALETQCKAALEGAKSFLDTCK